MGETKAHLTNKTFATTTPATKSVVNASAAVPNKLVNASAAVPPPAIVGAPPSAVIKIKNATQVGFSTVAPGSRSELDELTGNVTQATKTSTIVRRTRLLKGKEVQCKQSTQHKTSKVAAEKAA